MTTTITLPSRELEDVLTFYFTSYSERTQEEARLDARDLLAYLNRVDVDEIVRRMRAPSVRPPDM